MATNGNAERSRASSAAGFACAAAAEQRAAAARTRRPASTSVERGPRVQRREHRADLRQRREHRDRLERRVAPPEHPVAPPDSRAPRSACAIRFAAALDLAERERVVVERRRDRVGRDAGRVLEDPADEEHRCGASRMRTPRPPPDLPIDNDCR